MSSNKCYTKSGEVDFLMDKNSKYIIFAFAGWLIFSVSLPAFQLISGVLDGMGLWDLDFFNITFTVLRVLIQVVGIGTVFVFAIPVVITAWKELKKK